MFISIGKNKLLFGELNEYANIKNKLSVNTNLFDEKMSSENVIIDALINGISSICQRNNTDINNNKKLKEVKIIYYNSKKKYKFFGPWKKGVTINKEIWKCDLNENLIEYSSYKKGKMQIKIINDFTLNSKLAKQTIYNSKNRLEIKIDYKYNQNMDLIEEKHYTGNGNIKGKYIYESVEKGNIKVSVLNNQDDIIANLEYIFSDNKLIEAKGYGYKDSLNIKLQCKYDTNGNKTEESCFVGNSRTDKVLYNYNNKGQREEDISFDKNDNARSIIKYNYDSKNRMISELYSSKMKTATPAVGQLGFAYAGIENKLDIIFEYDTENNWNKRTIMLLAKPSNNNVFFRPISISERNITYY